MMSRCDCKSSCCVKKKQSGTRGCPCKGMNAECSEECKCGTRKNPCKNKAMAEVSERQQGEQIQGTRPKQARGKGFRLSHNLVETEEALREKEHRDVKDFIGTLDEPLVRKLAIRSLRRGIGSMDYIDSLLIMENDLDEDEDLGEFGQSFTQQSYIPQADSGPSQQNPDDEMQNSTASYVPDWCVCGRCQPMPQEIENKCCKLKKCITSSSRFTKLCLDPDVLELCIRNASDIRNDREDNSTRAFRKVAYRQFILARHGHLGKGNRRVCPSCVVLKIRKRFPSITGVYMGYREH